MESTRVSGELVDNPLEYHRYVLSRQVFTVKRFLAVFPNDVFICTPG